MAVPFRLSDAVDVYDERIKKIWFREAARDPEKYKDYICTDSTDLYQYGTSGFSGLGRAKQTAENASVEYDTPSQGFDLTYTQRQFTLGFSVTKMLWKFDNKNELYVLVKSLLINGENLMRKAMATLNKQVKKFTVQLQRLSEETSKVLVFEDATVRSCAKA